MNRVGKGIVYALAIGFFVFISFGSRGTRLLEAQAPITTSHVDSICRQNGFDYGVGRWGWRPNLATYTVDFGPNGTAVAGTDASAAWTASPAVNGVVAEAANGDTKVYAGGTAGTVNAPIRKISHLTFCNNYPKCGDGVVNQDTEQCDGSDGVGLHQICFDQCTLIDVPYCGDGIQNNDEQCDGQSGVGLHQLCSDQCTLTDLTYCGDGIQQSPNDELLGGPNNNGFEACDGLQGIGENEACTAQCTIISTISCGDGIVNGNEECDGSTDILNYICTNECTLEYVPFCGDNIVNQQSEQCDGTAGVGPHQSCDQQCILHDVTYCGDGAVQTPNDEGTGGPLNDGNEECDLGYSGIDEVCTQNCTLIRLPFCGDGSVNQLSEQCDDGNITDGDGCTASCQLEGSITACKYEDVNGDGVIDTGDTLLTDWEITVKSTANLVSNGSFELPVGSNPAGWDIFQDGTASLDWSVAWESPQTTFGDTTRPLLANIEYHFGVASWLPSEGSQYAELDTDWDGPSGPLNGEPASVRISQNLVTTPGATYKISFDFSPRPGEGSSNNALEVDWDGAAVDTLSADGTGNGNTAWVTHSYTVTASSALTKIEFADEGTADSLGTFLDNIKVMAVDTKLTGQNGCVTFVPLPFGEYAVSETVPGGWTQILPANDSFFDVFIDIQNPQQTVNFLNARVGDNNEGGGEGGSICGNDTIEVGETCDDDNTINGDGCSSQCLIEQTTNGGGGPITTAGGNTGGNSGGGGGGTPGGGAPVFQSQPTQAPTVLGIQAPASEQPAAAAPEKVKVLGFAYLPETGGTMNTYYLFVLLIGFLAVSTLTITYRRSRVRKE